MVLARLFGKDLLLIYRIIARLLDYFILFLVAKVVFSFFPFFLDAYEDFLALAVFFLWIPIEAFCISKWGTTPGKALFGIGVCDEKGAKLKTLRALRRAAFLFPRPGVISQRRLSLARRISGFIIAVACLAMTFFGKTLTHWSMGWEKGMTNSQWIQYDRQDAGFSVQFPNDPKEESKKLKIPSANKVLSYQEITSHENKDVHYSVSYMDFPRKWKWAGSGTLLKGALDALVKHTPNAVLAHREVTSHQSYRAMDFRLRQGGNEIKGRLIIVGTKLYKLTITYPISAAKEFEDNPFFNSFDLRAGQ